jgi:hypothetical protein
MDEPCIQKFMSEAPKTLQSLKSEFPDLYQQIIESAGYPFNLSAYKFWFEKIRNEFQQHQPIFDFVTHHNTQDPLTCYVGFKLDPDNADQLLMGINLGCYRTLQYGFLKPDVVVSQVDDMTPFDAALTCATKMHQLCTPVGDIYLARIYARQANFLKASDSNKAKEYCKQALEALRGFYLHHQQMVTPTLRDYDQSLNDDIHQRRETLLHMGLLSSQEIVQMNTDWGITSNNLQTSSSPQSRITV